MSTEHVVTGQPAADSRSERRAEAWGLAIQGYYDAALEILEDLLKEIPLDVISLRLKGNVLELKEMHRLECSGRKLTSSPDYLAARVCYEMILTVDPENVRARIDLGDHYRNLDANEKALEYYSEAMIALQRPSPAPSPAPTPTTPPATPPAIRPSRRPTTTRDDSPP